jgi:hypothetical protein
MQRGRPAWFRTASCSPAPRLPPRESSPGRSHEEERRARHWQGTDRVGSRKGSHRRAGSQEWQHGQEWGAKATFRKKRAALVGRRAAVPISRAVPDSSLPSGTLRHSPSCPAPQHQVHCRCFGPAPHGSP